MRTPFVAGNWKMHKTVEESRELISEMIPLLINVPGVEKVICPPFTSLYSMTEKLKGTDIGLGAQNMHWESKGAFTGEISPGMIAPYCHYVIIGHSERRKYFGETDETVNKKVLSALDAGLVPIICIGETEEEHIGNLTGEVVSRQIRDGFKGIPRESARNLVIAYEPIWAIGTGHAASAENAEAVIHTHIRKNLGDLFDVNTAQAIRILYGGSVTGNNAGEFFSQPNIDGALVGGASLKAEEFCKIVMAAKPN